MSFFEGVYIKSSNLSNQCTVVHVLFDLDEFEIDLDNFFQ